MSEYKGSTQEALKKQKNVALTQFFLEFPNLAALIVFAVMGRSLILFADAVGSLALLMQTWIVFVISKKLAKNESLEYDYGLGKFESFGGLITNILLYIGLIVVLFSSFYVILSPIRPSDVLLLAIILKVINTSFDVWLLFRQRIVSKMAEGKLIDAQNHVLAENLVFDIISLSAIIILYVFRDYTFAVYFEPALCIIYSIFMMISIVKPLKACIYDLLDKTSDEDIQLKIMKALAGGNDYYDSFDSVRTRSSGQTIHIDLLIGFSEDRTYTEINAALTILEELITKEIPNSVVSIVLTNK
ncbi:MAG: cation transporter [Lachnospiraceae bacterium]|jgi:divalent metal cation (Fe/Co/Zn/Cd) transporter|nr:cation transporter [Lachnospiraceae bacterium]